MYKAIIAGLLMAGQAQAFDVVETELTVVDVSLQCEAQATPEGADPVYTESVLICQFAGSSDRLERILGAAMPDGYRWACHPAGSRYRHRCVIP